MIMLSRKKQNKIILRLNELIEKREALEILQKEFGLTLYVIMLYIKDSDTYKKFIEASDKNMRFEIDRSKRLSDMVLRIEKLYISGKSALEISDELGICKRTVNKYIKIYESEKEIKKDIV